LLLLKLLHLFRQEFGTPGEDVPFSARVVRAMDVDCTSGTKTVSNIGWPIGYRRMFADLRLMLPRTGELTQVDGQEWSVNQTVDEVNASCAPAAQCESPLTPPAARYRFVMPNILEISINMDPPLWCSLPGPADMGRWSLIAIRAVKSLRRPSRSLGEMRRAAGSSRCKLSAYAMLMALALVMVNSVLALHILRYDELQHCGHRDVEVQIYTISDQRCVGAKLSKGWNVPGSNGMNGIDDTRGQLTSLPSLAGGSFIKNVIWLAVYPRKVCIKQSVVLKGRWHLWAVSGSQCVFTKKKAVAIGAYRTNWSGKPMLGWRCGGCGRCCCICCASTATGTAASGGVGAFLDDFFSTASLTLSATTASDSIYAFQQGFEYVGFGTSFLGHRVCIPYRSQLKTWQASQDGRSRLHLIFAESESLFMASFGSLLDRRTAPTRRGPSVPHASALSSRNKVWCEVGRRMTRYGIRKLNERCDSRISSFNFLAPGSRPVVAEAVFKSGERCMKDGAVPISVHN
ncbi:hypothetical protein KCU83_g461, partial [Aureobasidium melanogenum]